MKKLHTEIQINAKPEVVWEILTDFDAYPEWNPFVVSLQGETVERARLETQIQPPGSRATTFKPTVTKVVRGRYFEWLGKLGIKGLFDGRHQYELVPTADGTKFIQREEFTGILVPLFSRMINGGTKAGFELMNQAIKERAEKMGAERG